MSIFKKIGRAIWKPVKVLAPIVAVLPIPQVKAWATAVVAATPVINKLLKKKKPKAKENET